MAYNTYNTVERKMQRELEADALKEIRKENNEARRQQSSILNCGSQINHFRRQEVILIDSLENAKTEAERYRYAKLLECCRANLAKWQRIAVETEFARK